MVKSNNCALFYILILTYFLFPKSKYILFSIIFSNTGQLCCFSLHLFTIYAWRDSALWNMKQKLRWKTSPLSWPSRLCSSVVLRSNYLNREVAKPISPALCEVNRLLSGNVLLLRLRSLNTVLPRQTCLAVPKRRTLCNLNIRAAVT